MSLAVYTTVYPGVEDYFEQWCRSLHEQADQEFELWIGLDAIDAERIRRVLGGNREATLVSVPVGATPAQVRQQVLSQLAQTCSKVVLVDSDDLLHPTRVGAARTALIGSDLTGCALRLIDTRGSDLGLTFGLPPQVAPDQVLPRNNVFGFSNSAYDCKMLRRCLPIPPTSELVDWYLATRAWLFGAKLAFDPVPRMSYRQHSNNTARLILPYRHEQIVLDTALVRRHFDHVLADPDGAFLPSRYEEVKKVAAEIDQFHSQVILNRAKLDVYVKQLNALQPMPLWWSSVAYPALGHMWK